MISIKIFVLLTAYVVITTKLLRAQDDASVKEESECVIPCDYDHDCRQNPNCNDKWFCINLKCMYYDPEPDDRVLAKCADIGDKCYYNIDCDWGNREKMHCPWYMCNQTTNKCFFLG